MELIEIKYNPEFIINFEGLIAKVSSTIYSGIKIYRFEWPDYSLDFLYKKNSSWDSYTLTNKKQINSLGIEVDKRLN